MKTKDIVLIGLFAALTLVLSYVRIPVGQVPITLQSLAVMVTASILGSRKGFFSILVYSLIWVLIAGGFNHTGGYIVAFPIGAYIIGFISERTESRIALFLGNLLGGIGIVYLVGVPWLRAWLGVDWATALAYGAIPFILWDVLKASVTVLIVPRLKDIIGHMGA